MKTIIVTIGAISVLDYSEKAIALRGETKPIKDRIKSMNGRFCAFLTDADGTPFKGWVFPKTKLEQVKAMLVG